MPRRLPAVAPRGPSSPAPAPASDAPALPAVPDGGDALARVRALAARPSGYLAEANPFTMALWSTLSEGAGAVIQRHAATMRANLHATMLPPDSDDPTERRASALDAVSPSLTVLQAVADAVAVRAMSGDQRAADMVAQRIEGSVGARRGDVDPAEAEQRARVRQTIEHIVRDMSERAAQRADTVLDVSPIPDSE